MLQKAGKILLVSSIYLLFPFPVAAGVVINELMPNPAATGDRSEWIELYNYSPESIDLRGWSIDGQEIGGDEPIVIQSGEFFIITRDYFEFVDEFGSLPNLLELAIGLTNGGDEIVLMGPEDYIDTVNYSSSVAERSWERIDYTCHNFQLHASAHSLNEENSNYSPNCGEQEINLAIYDLFITEFMPNPEGADSGNEWVEIYNPNSTVINLFGVRLSDSAGEILSFGSQDEIQPGQYAVISFPSAVLLNCTSADCSDGLVLQVGEEIIDEVTYSSSESGQSWSLTDDGGWTLDYLVTPGAANEAKPPIFTTILISEVYPVPDSTLGEQEWLELFNYGDEAINLEGWEIRDNSGTHHFQESFIGPEQHLVVSNPSISLNNTGEVLRLISPDEEQIDKFSYSGTSKREGWAREWNGNYSKVPKFTTVLTPGGRNVIFVEAETPLVPEATDAAKQEQTPSVLSAQNEILTSSLVPDLPSTTLHLLEFSHVANGQKVIIQTWPFFLLCLLLSAGWLTWELGVPQHIYTLWNEVRS